MYISIHVCRSEGQVKLKVMYYILPSSRFAFHYGRQVSAAEARVVKSDSQVKFECLKTELVNVLIHQCII